MKRIVIVIAAAAALGLAGCSSSAQSAPSTGSGQTAATGGSTGTGRTPGVSGLVAAVTGSTAQVQGANQQTAVTWTRTTRFTDQVVVAASAVTVGECVMVRPARGGRGAQGSSGSSTSVAAASVELLPKQGGTCAFGGFAGRTGPRPSGAPTGTAVPRPGAGTGAGGRGFGAVGTVSAVRFGQFTVTPVVQPGATATAPISVTYTSSTVFTRLTAASASAVKVGVCVTAQGRTDDTGAMTARTITVSAATNGTCESGFGGRGPGGGRGAGGGAGNGGGGGTGGATSTAGAGNA